MEPATKESSPGARVRAELRSLRNELEGIYGSLVTTSDGLLVAHDIPELEPTHIAALVATTLSLARQATLATGRGEFREAVARGTAGYLAVYAAGRNAVVAVLGTDELNIGMLHYQTRGIIERVAQYSSEFDRFHGGSGTPPPGITYGVTRRPNPVTRERSGEPAHHTTGNTAGMSNLRYSESIVIARSPEALYDMVSDVTRMGEWSPVCTACWWDDGDGPWAGAWFTGRNELPERTWETRSQVVAAERGQEFAFAMRGSWVRWGYTFASVDAGTRVTESWEFLPDGITGFRESFGEDAQAQIANRSEAARAGIPATLAAIKKAAESAA